MKRTKATGDRRLQLQKVEIKELAVTDLEQAAGGGGGNSNGGPGRDDVEGGDTDGIRLTSSRLCGW